MSVERAWGSNRRVDWVALRIGSAFGHRYPVDLSRPSGQGFISPRHPVYGAFSLVASTLSCTIPRRSSEGVGGVEVALSIACLDEGKSLLGNGLHHTSLSATPSSHAIENGLFGVASASYFPAVRGDPVMPQCAPIATIGATMEELLPPSTLSAQSDPGVGTTSLRRARPPRSLHFNPPIECPEELGERFSQGPAQCRNRVYRHTSGSPLQFRDECRVQVRSLRETLLSEVRGLAQLPKTCPYGAMKSLRIH